MLYDLLFRPVVVLLKYLYLAIFSCTGDWGTSLVLLAIVMNVLLRPLMAWAARLQQRERKLQDILAPQIREIKRELHGAEQHAELTELYRRYAYHPIYAVRSNAGLFIQLPFLIAAYAMLSSLELLEGQPYLFIRDLSLPDSLWHGINLLPLLMTAVNLLAAWTTENFGTREKLQASVIGLLFLLLLYGAPSALLIYWTSNNVILLLKNLALPVRRFLGAHVDVYEISGRRFLPVGRWRVLIHILAALSMFAILGCYVFFFKRGFIGLRYDELSRLATFHNAYICAFLFVFALVWMLFWRFLSWGWSLAELAAKAAYMLTGALVLLAYIRFTLFPLEFSEGAYFKIFFIMLASYLFFALLLPVPGTELAAFARRLTGGKEGALYFSSILFFTIFLCIFYPSLLFLTDPSFFPDSLSVTLLKLGPYGVGLVLMALMFWLLLPVLLRRVTSVMLVFMACMALLNAFIITEHYGNLDAIMFKQPLLLMQGIRVLLKDLGSALLALFILYFCIKRRWMGRLVTVLWSISFALICVSGYCYLSSTLVKGGNSQSPLDFPPYHDRLWRFSKTEKNIVGFFFDGFAGDHLLQIVRENPELVQKLDGFTDYPDTLATGDMTFFSTPSIYAGPRYRVDELDRNEPQSLVREKFARSLTVLPSTFIREGYDVVMAGTPYLESGDADFLKHVREPGKLLLLYGDNWGKDYIPYWSRWAAEQGMLFQDKSVDISRFLLNLSLFRVIPFSLRTNLYNWGHWRGDVVEQVLAANMKTHFMPNLPPMQFMHEFIRADEGKPTFKMIRSMLSHFTWHLTSEDLHPVLDPYPDTSERFTLVDGIIPEHYYTETHMMRFVADFVASLKRLGVYDNTRIVIFSDHDFGDSWGLNKYVGREVYRGSPNALLMFKDFGSHGPLRFSEALMSCEDIPTLLLEGIERVDGIPDMEALRRISGPDRVRVHCVDAKGAPDPEQNQFGGEILDVKGTIFRKENWSKRN